MMIKQPNPVDRFVGMRVRVARHERHMSQEKLAGKLGLTVQQVQKHEKGANRIGSSRLQLIAQILDKPVSWFFPAEGEPAGATSQISDLAHELLTTRDGMGFAELWPLLSPTERHLLLQLARAITNRALPGLEAAE